MVTTTTIGSRMLGTVSLHTGPFVAVDIETTGSRPGRNAVIEIGAVRVENGAIVDSFTSLVASPEPVPPAIRHLTGIDDAMLIGAPPIAEVIERFRAFAEGAVLVAHNHRFDLGFLDYEAERLWGSPFPRPVLDTLSLSRRLRPGLEQHNLAALAQRLGTETRPSHRALPDALATAEVLIGMLAELTATGMCTAAEAADYCGVATQSALARKLPLATHLPDSPGLYLFRDETGRVLYVGRAKNLRSRVRSHFYAPIESDDAPASRTVKIDHVPCVSALDALLLESRLLERYRPPHNHHQYRLKEPVFLHIDDRDGYPALRVTRRRMRNGLVFGPLWSQPSATTLVEALSLTYGLRRCSRPLASCARTPCGTRTAAVCPAATAAGLPAPRSYARSVTAALAVLNGGADAFRASLLKERDLAVATERYEQAIFCRDAIRALDRTLGALAVGRRAAAEPLGAIVEGDVTCAVVHVLVNGWRFTTLRFTREQVARKAHIKPLLVAMERAARQAGRPTRLTPRHLRDIAIIDAYRQEHRPRYVSADGDTHIAAARVAAALRRSLRIPRPRHGDASVV